MLVKVWKSNRIFSHFFLLILILFLFPSFLKKKESKREREKIDSWTRTRTFKPSRANERKRGKKLTSCHRSSFFFSPSYFLSLTSSLSLTSVLLFQFPFLSSSICVHFLVKNKLLFISFRAKWYSLLYSLSLSLLGKSVERMVSKKSGGKRKRE